MYGTSQNSSFDDLLSRFFFGGQTIPTDSTYDRCDTPLPSGKYDPTGEWDDLCGGRIGRDGICNRCGTDHTDADEKEAA